MNFIYLMQLVSAISWIIVYILIIKKGFKDKTYGMPFVALCLNLGWEFVFTFLHKTTLHNEIVFATWLILDIIILFIFLKYGYKYISKKYHLRKFSFYTLTFFSIITSIILMYIAPIDFLPLFYNDILQCAGFVAYFQNLIMSVLFVTMLLQRQSLSGQSFYIALFKWIGTLSVALLKITGTLSTNFTELFVIFLIQIFDIIYIYLTIKYKRK